MAVTTRFLVDTSVVARMDNPDVSHRLDPLIRRGLVSLCDVAILEIGHWAGSIENYDQLREDFGSLFTWVPLPDDVFHRVQKLQRSLVQIGAHRSIKIPDLCIAATAAVHNLTVLHYNHDFELISAVASVREEWVVKRGSIG
jgi:predicted nucleic acid-binding protein